MSRDFFSCSNPNVGLCFDVLNKLLEIMTKHTNRQSLATNLLYGGEAAWSSKHARVEGNGHERWLSVPPFVVQSVWLN